MLEILVPEKKIIVTFKGGQTLPGSSQSRFEFTQSVASASWTVNHNLGYKPFVTILNAGSQEVIAEVNHTNNNQFVVLLNSPMSGLALYM